MRGALTCLVVGWVSYREGMEGGVVVPPNPHPSVEGSGVFGFQGERSIEERDGSESSAGDGEFVSLELGNPLSEGVA